MPLLIKKNPPIFGEIPFNGGGGDRTRDLSDHPTWRQTCYWLSYNAGWRYLGQIQTKYYKYYVYIIRDGLQGSFLRKQALKMYNNLQKYLFIYVVSHNLYLSSNIGNKGE